MEAHLRCPIPTPFAAIMVKLAFFQIFNTCVAAATFLFQVDDIRQWFTFGGTLIANVCLGDAIFIQILLDFLQIPVIIRRWCIAPCQRSQQAMDEAYTAPAGIYLAFRVQLAVKFTVLAATFGSAIPTLYAYAAFYFWLAAWIDRFNLLRRLAPPPVTDASLTATAAIVIFPVAVLLHVLFALYVFYTFANLAAPSSPHALAPPQLPPLSLPPPVLPPVLPPLNPPNMSGLLLTLTVAPPPAPPHLPPSVPPPFQPPLPPHCHQTYNTAWSAFYLQFITSAVAVGVLTLFLLRELSRYCGCHLRLLSDKQRKVIMQVPHHWARISPASRTTPWSPLISAHLYTPLLLAGHHAGARRGARRPRWGDGDSLCPSVGRLPAAAPACAPGHPGSWSGRPAHHNRRACQRRGVGSATGRGGHGFAAAAVSRAGSRAQRVASRRADGCVRRDTAHHPVVHECLDQLPSTCFARFACIRRPAPDWRGVLSLLTVW